MYEQARWIVVGLLAALLAQLRHPKNNPYINQHLTKLSKSVWHYTA